MKIKRNLSTEENKKWWEHIDYISKKVDSWPEWKKNVNLTKYKTGEYNERK